MTGQALLYGVLLPALVFALAWIMYRGPRGPR